MIILLLGKNGQLGAELSQTLLNRFDVHAYGRDEIDITDHDALIALIGAVKPDVIINAAAYTAVDKAESDQKSAFEINSTAVSILAKEASLKDVLFIHYSTDYVFDGKKAGAYLESDSTQPINVYGASKLDGEERIAKACGKYLIFRTTWVIGEHGNNFAKTILRLSQEKEQLKIISDQYGVPTSTKLIAKVTQSAIDATLNGQSWESGIYHLTPTGITSWYGVAKKLLELAESESVSLKVSSTNLGSIRTSDYPTAAKRPTNSVLDTEKLQTVLPYSLPSWEVDFEKTAVNIIKEKR